MIQKIKPYTSRADLHVHTKYSDKPTEWFLKRIGAPECFVEPKDVYKSAQKAGMQYVTISDHNCIDGALEISHLPGTFISVELTCRFPENDAKMHILATGITEDQFKILDEIRHDIYELRNYFHQEDIIYSVAHPLFLVNDKLTIDQFEKLLLLFNRFEIINGTRDPRAATITNALLDHLTPEFITRLADKHDIEPHGPAPHIKMKTAGSDDHSGQYVASAYTTTPEASTTAEYLNHLRAGRHEHGGSSGNSLHLAHCFYHIAHSFYKNQLLGQSGSSLLGELFKQLLGERNESPKKKTGFIQNWLMKRHIKKLSSAERLIVEESQQLLNMETASPKDAPPYQQAFDISCRLSHGLLFALVKKAINKGASGDLFKTLEAAGATVPIITAIMPYLAAFKTQNKDEKFTRQIASHFEGVRQYEDRSQHIGWLVDNLEGHQEAATSLKNLGSAAIDRGASISAIYCSDHHVKLPVNSRRFAPVGHLKLSEHLEKTPFPPFLNILNYIEQRQFKELILSSTGPMGLVGLFAARMFHLKTTAIVHSSFGESLRFATDDYGLENFGHKYTSWFYSQCDRVLVHTNCEKEALIEHGVNASKIQIMPRGIDQASFNSDKHSPNYWHTLEAKQPRTLLYRGSTHKQSNLELILEAFVSLKKHHKEWQFVIVSDDKLKKLKNKYSAKNIQWIKRLPSESLSHAVQSSDLYIDLRNLKSNDRSMVEAIACGIPVIAIDKTAAADWISSHQCGQILSLLQPTPKQTISHLQTLLDSYMSDDDIRIQHGLNAAKLGLEMSWSQCADILFQIADCEGVSESISTLESGAVLV